MVSAFSIPQSKRDQKVSENPGPGQYSPEQKPTRQKQPNYSIGKDKRESHEKNEVPGPGSYSHEVNTHVEKPPSFSFGSKLKEPQIYNANLGPGSYNANYEAEKQKSPSFSMKPRNHSALVSNVPGPGNYEPYTSSVLNDHVTKFGSQKRNSTSDLKVPGPGSYEYTEAFNKYSMRNQPRYGFGSKLDDKDKQEVPGPGSYQEKHDIYSKIGGIMSRDIRLSMHRSQVPGPGTYNGEPIAMQTKNPSFSLPKSRRDADFTNRIPGPGSYESPNSFKKSIEKLPDIKFSHEEKLKQELNYVPGPGSYQPKQSFFEKRVYMGAKTKDMRPFDVPGPGSYQANYLFGDLNPSKYSIGKQSRDLKNNNEVPGPGSYNREDHSLNGPKIGFGIDKRLKDHKSEVPGPGKYDLKPHFADVPKYLMPNKN